MARAPQKRMLETRARLIAAAEKRIDADGYAALRVEDVVRDAGVAKGTFFAHFADKDALLDRLIAERIDMRLDELAGLPPATSLDAFLDAVDPLMAAMTADRVAFDLIMRRAGAMAVDDVGPIATTFGRQIAIFADQLADGPFRKDVSPALLAEGVQALAIQAMALQFCALHQDVAVRDRLRVYLAAWLTPAISAPGG